MKIAILSDIHGNSDALTEVLKEARKQNIDHILVLGDIVGYYYHPDKILEMLSEWSFDIIKGNHEKILETLIDTPSLEESIRLKYGSGHQEALKKLTKNQLKYLSDLPETKTVQFEDVTLLMCHGSPWANDYYIYPDCKNEIRLKCDSKEHDFVLIGHSHYAFAIQNKNSTLINPGSVGQSRQTGRKASWCIINTSNKCFQFVSTDYKIENLVNEISAKDDNNYLSEILRRK